MTSLHITRGLPGSGKTTFAKAWVDESPTTRTRVNRDDLRDMLFGSRVGLTFEQEQHVTSASHALVRAHLRRGLDVITDDTNLRPRHVREWRKIAAQHDATFEVHEMDPSPEASVGRDLDREHRVGADVIYRLAQTCMPGGKYLPVPPEAEPESLRAYERPEGKPSAIVVDIDGTVALMGSRSPYDTTTVDQDQPHTDVIDVVSALSSTVDRVIFLSGRDEECRDLTEAWLREHVVERRLMSDYELHMRPAGDRRRDSIVKAELFDRHVRDEYRVLVVLDDRKQVVDMWRSLGLTCLQVAEGDF